MWQLWNLQSEEQNNESEKGILLLPGAKVAVELLTDFPYMLQRWSFYSFQMILLIFHTLLY